jgi:branched-chain amino acid transport system substrate-binding protein
MGGLRLALLLFCSVLWFSGDACAQISNDVVKIGVINDMDGPYSELSGKGSVVAAQIAIDELKADFPGRIELISAGHQLKPDVGTGIIRRWFDSENVDVVVDLVHSAIALAAQELAKSRNRIVIATAVGTTDFTGKSCTSKSASWLYDTYALSNGLVTSMVHNKLDTWFTIAVDYAFGLSMTNDATRAVEAAGGKVLGVVRHPLNTSDFASYLLQAQASGAKVVLLASGGADLVNAIKQSKEFGITSRGQVLATPLMFITDVRSLGLQAAQGLSFTTPFYWDRNDETRAWSNRFRELHGAPPTMVHAAVYSAVRHYLKAVKAVGSDEAQAVMAKMREIPVNDMYVKNGILREDGRLLHPMYLVEVKKPSESTGLWDFYKIKSTIPAEQAFLSAREGGCPLAK